MKKKYKELELIKCPNCNYYNRKINVTVFGTCTRCGEIIDKKAKYDYERYVKLKLWRSK